MEYTKIPANAFDMLQMNAGIVCRSFDPDTGTVSEILGTTSGGVQVNSNPSFVDFGEDMDNVPGNTKQLKRVTGYDPTISGTMISVDDQFGLYNLQGGLFWFTHMQGDPTHVEPLQGAIAWHRDIWLVGDYSAVNDSDEATGVQAGFCAVHLLNAQNTAGFQWQTAKDAKGQFSFEFHGHYDLEDIETAPFEIYVKGHIPVITNQPQDATVAAGENVIFTVVATGAESYQWQRSSDGGSTWANVSAADAHTATLSFLVTSNLDGRKYRCEVTNSLGSVMSDVATLTVASA